ncbi:uncharacterized protein BJX67DRAFT_229112 [Aspergillus lucknowensis]|uniref:Uncharacterized protein n=1 Tax=Aspergillus lucknowensis TaxID=176173 RepID=A0ABR4LHG4_9EURO
MESTRLQQSIRFGHPHRVFVREEIEAPDIATAKQVIDEAGVHKETIEWDCQNYALEILEACHREAVFEEDDSGYAVTKQLMRRKRGLVSESPTRQEHGQSLRTFRLILRHNCLLGLGMHDAQARD